MGAGGVGVTALRCSKQREENGREEQDTPGNLKSKVAQEADFSSMFPGLHGIPGT